MNAIPKKIIEFINENRVASVCFNDENQNPYCISCFFVLNDEEHSLIFKSSFGSSHDNIIQTTAKVSGTILPENFEILKIKGIQFTGQILPVNHPHAFLFNSQYYKKYPAGLVMPGIIWSVKLDFLKYTDNTLGFGNKTQWRSLQDSQK